MFEKFTDRARRVVVLAQEEARMLNHNYIGTEHILLGLIHEGEGVAAQALESLGISLEAVRQQVEEIIGQGQQAPSGHIPFTPRVKKVFELSLREALQLGHNYIGTEHILLGLIREGEGVAAQVLVKLGADLSRVRQQVIQLLHGYQGKEAAVVAGRPSVRAGREERQAAVTAAGPGDRAGVAAVGHRTARGHRTGCARTRPADRSGPPRQGSRRQRPGLRERSGVAGPGEAAGRREGLPPGGVDRRAHGPSRSSRGGTPAQRRDRTSSWSSRRAGHRTTGRRSIINFSRTQITLRRPARSMHPALMPHRTATNGDCAVAHGQTSATRPASPHVTALPTTSS